MNILILNWRDIRNPKAGGAELVTFEHAKAWIKKGHSVYWFTSRFPGSLKEETIEGVHFVRQGGPFSVYLCAPFFYLLSNKTFDVVVDEIHGIPFFTPFFVRKPKIAFIHEIAGEIWNYMYPFPINQAGKLLETFYLFLYQNMQFWTDAPSTITELVAHGIKRNNCTAIACAITNKVLAQLPKKEKNPTFIFVSRLVKMKGIERVLASFKEIHRGQPDAQLWLVGGGEKEYVNKLHAIVDSYGLSSCIKFFGRVSEEKKLDLMKKAHILLHASVKEGWGLVVLEAASQATPAVVYNVAGLCDSVQHNKTGIVCSQNTPSELSKQALLLYKDSNRYKQFQNNCLIYTKSLSWEKVTKESEKLLQSL